MASVPVGADCACPGCAGAAWLPVSARKTSSRLGWPSAKSLTPIPALVSPAERVRGELAGGLGALLCRDPGGDDGRVGLVVDDDLVVGDQVAGAVPLGRVQQPDPDAGAAHGVLQLAAGARGDHPAVVDDRDPVGQPVGLVEVLRGEQDRCPVRHDAADDLPQCAAAARVQAGGRLVQEQQVGSDDDAGREVQLAAHAAR